MRFYVGLPQDVYLMRDIAEMVNRLLILFQVFMNSSVLEHYAYMAGVHAARLAAKEKKRKSRQQAEDDWEEGKSELIRPCSRS